MMSSASADATHGPGTDRESMERVDSAPGIELDGSLDWAAADQCQCEGWFAAAFCDEGDGADRDRVTTL